MGRRRRAAQARVALVAILDGGGGKREQLEAIAPLRSRDAPIHTLCEQLIQAENPARAIKLLDRASGAPDEDFSAAAANAPAALRARASAAAMITSALWAVAVVILWAAYPGMIVGLSVLGAAVVLSGAAAVVAGGWIKHAYKDFVRVEPLVKLPFLLVLLPIGFVMMLFYARSLRTGMLKGMGHDARPGGGYARFEKIYVGGAATPLAATLLAITFGYTAALIGFAVRSGVIPFL
jgi:hypothetical protein